MPTTRCGPSSSSRAARVFVVVSVKGGGLAVQAGLQVNDVMLSLGDQPAKSTEQIRKALLGLGEEALEVKLIRQGKPTRLSLVGPKHGAGFVRMDYWIGVPVSPVDTTLRTHLPSLAADTGLIANDVVKGSPAEKAGVRKNDILVTLGGKPLKDPAALVEQVRASEGKPIPLDLLRAGKSQSITITPEKRAASFTLSRTNNAPAAVRFTYDVVKPNMAILEGVAEAAGRGNNGVLSPDFAEQFAKGLELKLQALTSGDAMPGKIEEQLKGMQAELEKLTKSLEGLSKLDVIVKELDELLKKPASK